MNINKYGFKFHHIGLAVKHLPKTSSFLTNLGYNISENIYDEEQKVHLRMCNSKHMPAIELISPGKEQGPIDNIIKNRGSTFYHLCFSCENVSQAIKMMGEDGIQIIEISPPKEAILFNRRKVSFYLIEELGIIEILEDK